MRQSRIIGYTKATLAAFCLLVITQSCQKSADLQASQPNTVSEAHIAELKQAIATSTGAPVSQISYSSTEQSFTVSKDAKLSLEEAEDYFKSTSSTSQGTQNTEQRVNAYTVSSTRVRNVTIYCDGSVPSDWVSIMDQAIANWNAAGSAIHFSRVTSQYTTTTTTTSGNGNSKKNRTGTTTTTSADVLVNSFNDATTSTIAQAYYPNSTGAPGQQVNINLYYTYLSTSYRVFALTHELGHLVGFTHTDQTYGSLIPGTPDVDGSSVMNSVCLSWVGFTGYDLTAFRTVYPY